MEGGLLPHWAQAGTRAGEELRGQVRIFSEAAAAFSQLPGLAGGGPPKAPRERRGLKAPSESAPPSAQRAGRDRRYLPLVQAAPGALRCPSAPPVPAGEEGSVTRRQRPHKDAKVAGGAEKLFTHHWAGESSVAREASEAGGAIFPGQAGRAWVTLQEGPGFRAPGSQAPPPRPPGPAQEEEEEGATWYEFRLAVPDGI